MEKNQPLSLQVQEGPSAGLARQHQMSRTATGWVPAIVVAVRPDSGDDDDFGFAEDEALVGDGAAEMEVPLDAQQTADAAADVWSKEWQVGACPPLPTWPATMGATMPLPCVELVRRACASFPAATGLGWDRFHPRALLRCSDAAIEALIRIFMLAEFLGKWPDAVGVVIMALIPKTDGGRRPIGLFPTLVRIWMRVRLPVAQEWQRAHERPYFYAGPTKGASVAAWKQAARAELGASLRLDYAAVLLDLVKAFDRIPHDWLVRQAQRYEYNLYLLRLSLAAYGLARVVRVAGVYAAAVVATRGITAGAGLATVELRMLLIEFLDEASRQCLIVTLTVYVDDVCAEATASAERVTQQLVAVIRLIVRRFTEMRLTFSATKNVCCASQSRIGLALVQALPELTLRYQRRVTSLGSGLGGGVRRNAGVAKTRLVAFKRRRGRFRSLRRAGVRVDRLVRTGGTAALSFGQAVVGVSPAMLLQQRRAVASATVASAGGGDLDITLMMADGGSRGCADPAFAAHVDPVWHWTMAVWEQWLPIRAMQQLVAGASRRLSQAKHPWGVVRGPAAAFVASVQRLGWTVHTAVEVCTDSGVTLRLCLGSPAFVKHAVVESVRRWRWRRVAAQLPSLDAGGTGAGAIMQPIYKLLEPARSSPGLWGPQQRAALRSAVTNRQWPQVRFAAAGFSSSNECQFCAADAQACALPVTPSPPGTLTHRLWSVCPTIKEALDEWVPRQLAAEAAMLLRDGPLDAAHWSRGLVPLPLEKVPPPPADETFVWTVQPSDGVLAGTVYTDGSLIDGAPNHCGVCGRLDWAFVAVNGEGEITASAHGVPPSWVTTIFGAELWTLQMAATCGATGIAYRTDCLSLLTVFRNGASWATSSSQYYARIWHVVFACFDDVTQADLEWMPAHTTAADVGRLRLSSGILLSAVDRMANAEADRLAKLAAASVRVPQRVRRLMDAAAARSQQLALWIGRATATAAGHGLPSWRGRDARHDPRPPRGPPRPRPATRREPVQQRARDQGGHLLERHGCSWRCAVCKRSSATWGTIAPGRCDGPALPRWAARACQSQEESDAKQHRIMATGAVSWCAKCGVYSEVRGRGLARTCRGRPASAAARARLGRLRAGQHPVTGAALQPSGALGVAALVPVESVAGAVARGTARWSALVARVRAREDASRAGGLAV